MAPYRDLRIHACEKGGFMVYGPEAEFDAFSRNGPLRPLAAFSEIGPALDFIREGMKPPPQGDGKIAIVPGDR